MSPQSPLQSPLRSVSQQSPLQSPLRSVSPQGPLQSPLRSVSPQSSLQSPLRSVSSQSPLQSPLRSVSPQSPLPSPLRSVSPQSPLPSPLRSVSPQSPLPKVRSHQTRMTRIKSRYSHVVGRLNILSLLASFMRIAPQECLSRLCIDLTCKSFARNASFASGVNAPCARSVAGSPQSPQLLHLYLPRMSPY